ncbi:MAG TPA: hypothetical protein VF884_11555 [Nitrososphaeraceae archaeon]
MGDSFRQIASFLGISSTAVYNFVKYSPRPLWKSRLCHELAVNLRKNGLDIDIYADLIRATHMLERNGIHPQLALKMMVAFVSDCHRLGAEPSELCSFLVEFHELVQNCKDKTLKEIREFLNDRIKFFFFLKAESHQVVENLYRLKREVEELRERKVNTNISLKLWIEGLEKRIKEAQNENGDLKEELEKRSAFTLQSVETDIESLGIIKKLTGITVTREQILDKAYRFFKFPHRFPSLFIKELDGGDFSQEARSQNQENSNTRSDLNAASSTAEKPPPTVTQPIELSPSYREQPEFSPIDKEKNEGIT